MRKLLVASAALIAGCGFASAAGTDSFDINGSIAPTCTIEAPTSSPDVELGAAFVGQDQYVGTATYTCNFNGFLSNLQASSLNSSKLVGPDGQVSYKFGFDVGVYAETRNTLGGPGDFATGGNWADGGATPAETGSRGVDLFVAITEAGTIAGDYTDTITISIAP